MPGRLSRGVAMIELMVALLVFSTGALGLVAAQLGGKRVGYDAWQRSVATALASDILARIRANPVHANLYAGMIEPAGKERLAPPSVDCSSVACSATQLAAFDLFQWQQMLHSALRSPRACVALTDGLVEVAISWLAVSRTGVGPSLACGEDDAPRQQLTFFTFAGVG